MTTKEYDSEIMINKKLYIQCGEMFTLWGIEMDQKTECHTPIISTTDIDELVKTAQRRI